MAVEIARANIEHLKRLLDTETDPKKRGVIERQLAEQKLKLAEALKARTEKKEG